MTYFDFSKQIRSLKNAGQLTEALEYFVAHKMNFPAAKIKSDSFLVANLITCLRKTGNVAAANGLLRAWNITIQEETNGALLTSYAWLLYNELKQENTPMEQRPGAYYIVPDDFFTLKEEDETETVPALPQGNLLQRIQQVMPLLQIEQNDYNQSAINRLFSLLIKSEKEKPSTNWAYLANLCSKLDPEKLDKTCESFEVERKGKKKQQEMASTYENWYATYTKALLEAEQYEQCYQLSKEALEKIDNYHYNNDVWFARRIALAKKALGKPEEALDELQAILTRKKDWFLYKEVAEIEFELGKKDALTHACEGMIQFGEMSFKVGLIFLIGNLLQKQREAELAEKHFLLIKAIKEEAGQQLPVKLLNTLMDLQLMDKNILRAETEKELKSYWQKNSLHAKAIADASEGFVKTILNENDKGVNGFIVSGTKDYYFTLPKKNNNAKKIKVNATVKFLPEKQDNGKWKAKILQVG